MNDVGDVQANVVLPEKNMKNKSWTRVCVSLLKRSDFIISIRFTWWVYIGAVRRFYGEFLIGSRK